MFTPQEIAMNRTYSLLFAMTLLAATSLGCAAKEKPAAAPVASSPAAIREGTSVDPAVAQAVQQNEGGGLSISPEIHKLCPGIQTPRFGYDSAEVRQEWNTALKQVAECMRSGGLSGHSLLLTGHTDPRGEEDYNMSLGGRRASAVKSAFVALGVDDERVQTTSRGKIDAQGTDEDSWARDRRVDIDLAQPRGSQVSSSN
jgi:peptidoglycan-associated lipoprotein